jgi:hypothetical protein
VASTSGRRGLAILARFSPGSAPWSIGAILRVGRRGGPSGRPAWVRRYIHRKDSRNACWRRTRVPRFSNALRSTFQFVGNEIQKGARGGESLGRRGCARSCSLLAEPSVRRDRRGGPSGQPAPFRLRIHRKDSRNLLLAAYSGAANSERSDRPFNSRATRYEGAPEMASIPGAVGLGDIRSLLAGALAVSPALCGRTARCVPSAPPAKSRRYIHRKDSRNLC